MFRVLVYFQGVGRVETAAADALSLAHHNVVLSLPGKISQMSDRADDLLWQLHDQILVVYLVKRRCCLKHNKARTWWIFDVLPDWCVNTPLFWLLFQSYSEDKQQTAVARKTMRHPVLDTGLSGAVKWTLWHHGKKGLGWEATHLPVSFNTPVNSMDYSASLFFFFFITSENHFVAVVLRPRVLTPWLMWASPLCPTGSCVVTACSHVPQACTVACKWVGQGIVLA